MNDQPRILFVCLGNICRSPLAEAALRAAAEREGVAMEVDSAGTSDNHVGASPDSRAIAEAKRQGIDISRYQGRQLKTQDFTRFTHIFALDHNNLADIESLAPADRKCRIQLLMDSVPGKNGHAVADPYYGDENDFSRTWDDVALAADALVERFKR
ncbi:low molecular weight phosphotyrosine protein phosphatase [Altererythrobacter sp. SALINAS58]|uniref:low molecular weight protein-tyrosine-phosphatase n=1 Tax=Alteripontixanthobacter muriae TaxID=2705546 RepID=UPI001576359A|nr:low molecular weight protein-tyrosine-phosphatase [Alteripontixanthobacter muriae]NTZ42099.1 low molecular weight phosphotyrosine protein phosphatase [Alteripontixanthobacter muriae]